MNADDLQRLLARHRIGEPVRLDFIRGHELGELEIVPVEAPQ
jgi:S1-C subfamily serine protease